MERKPPSFYRWFTILPISHEDPPNLTFRNADRNARLPPTNDPQWWSVQSVKYRTAFQDITKSSNMCVTGDDLVLGNGFTMGRAQLRRRRWRLYNIPKSTFTPTTKCQLRNRNNIINAPFRNWPDDRVISSRFEIYMETRSYVDMICVHFGWIFFCVAQSDKYWYVAKLVQLSYLFRCVIYKNVRNMIMETEKMNGICVLIIMVKLCIL